MVETATISVIMRPGKPLFQKLQQNRILFKSNLGFLYIESGGISGSGNDGLIHPVPNKNR
jgi:hypothetical protein